MPVLRCGVRLKQLPAMPLGANANAISSGRTTARLGHAISNGHAAAEGERASIPNPRSSVFQLHRKSCWKPDIRALSVSLDPIPFVPRLAFLERDRAAMSLSPADEIGRVLFKRERLR